MKCTTLLFLAILLLLQLVSAETTFFDNSNDVFIMGNSPTGEVTGGTTGGTTSGGCLYKWNCTNWSECLSSGKQTRNCTNIGSCSSTYKSPEIEQNCTYTDSPKVEKDKEGEKENVTEEEEVVPEEQEIEETSEKEIVNKNKVFIYSIILLVVISIIFYLKKDYFKKLIQKIK